MGATNDNGGAIELDNRTRVRYDIRVIRGACGIRLATSDKREVSTGMYNGDIHGQPRRHTNGSS
jgi:hypothetical protein